MSMDDVSVAIGGLQADMRNVQAELQIMKAAQAHAHEEIVGKISELVSAHDQRIGEEAALKKSTIKTAGIWAILVSSIVAGCSQGIMAAFGG